MKCFVCNQEYEGHECTKCRFPNVQMPGVNREKAMQDLAPAIQSYRTVFLQNVQLDVVTYHWKDDNGVVVLDREELIPLGSGTELYCQGKWLEQKFARMGELSQIPVKIRITRWGTVREEQVAIPNLTQPMLQQLGAEMDEDFQIRLKLSNGLEVSFSQPVAV